MSPRFASAITSRPASRAYLHVSSNACIPAEPSASKKASCGLTATQAGAAASMRPRQKRANALPGASPCNSTGSRSSTGSSPRTSWLRLRSTASATRSPNTVVPTSTWLTAWSLGDGSALGTRGQDLGRVEMADGELRRRAAEELRDDEQLVRALCRERGGTIARRAEPGLDLERAAALGKRARRGDPAAGNEERAPEAGLGGGRDEAEPRGAQPPQPRRACGAAAAAHAAVAAARPSSARAPRARRGGGS